MLKRTFSKIAFICLGISFLFTLFSATSAGAEDDIDWQELKTRHTIIRYLSPEDLRRFDKKIKYASDPGLSLFSRSSKADDPDERLIKKIDAVYRRVQEILDMRKSMERIKINIYQTKDQLHEAYFRIYKNHRKLRAWYVFEFNTIYLTVEDVFEGMLAHEMAHSIIDHYLTVRPPPASAEILARYVDSHLVP